MYDFIVTLTILYLYEEFTLTSNRTIYQKIIDRSLIIILFLYIYSGYK